MTPPLPNLRHLAVLSSVAQLHSVSAAARAAHLSQPAVTQAIAALERDFQRPLFFRTAQGMEPTEAGRVVREIGLTLRLDWQPTAVQAELLETLRGVARSTSPAPGVNSQVRSDRAVR